MKGVASLANASIPRLEVLSVGLSFNAIASATWKDIKTHTPKSKIPAAVSQLVQIMASEFKYSVVYVGGDLAKLGIK